MLADSNKNDIILTTYGTLRADWVTKGPLRSKEWYRFVLDEAHHIRNRSCQTFKAAYDYGALISFLGIPSLTDKSMFDFWITSPINENKSPGYKRLQSLIRATCLRRTKESVNDSLQLPPRLERTESIELPRRDRELYTFFKDITAAIAGDSSISSSGPLKHDDFKESNILSLIGFLRLICNHGQDLLPHSALAAWKASAPKLIDWQAMKNFRRRCGWCDTDLESSFRLTAPELLCEHTICMDCTQQSGPASSVRRSAKVEALLRNLAKEQASRSNSNTEGGPKSVIFSYWTKMLDLIQKALEAENFGIQRIDGKTSLEQRGKAMHQFAHNPKYTITLASIGSAGEGLWTFSIDLTAANSVHLIEPHWNPMAGAQAVDRIHRIGQTREVTVTRYIVSDSVETVSHPSIPSGFTPQTSDLWLPVHSMDPTRQIEADQPISRLERRVTS
ncbi:MAG: hypothetical protein Q9160_003744 [Pyrenula sp. 1 TL-2023]